MRPVTLLISSESYLLSNGQKKGMYVITFVVILLYRISQQQNNGIRANLGNGSFLASRKNEWIYT
jgi:hypothetical protein